MNSLDQGRISDAADKPSSLVTIGIPVFNGEKHLAQALDSALAQDCPNLEILISDNASTDGTQDICKEYRRRDSRIRYHRNKENLGASGNFQEVLKRANGEYFTWLACDDILTRGDYVSKLAGYLDTNPDVVLCGCTTKAFVGEDLRATCTHVLEAVAPERDWKEARKEFFRWPQTACHFVIYGLYRRRPLLKVPVDGRTHWGRPVVLDMEFPILSRLSNFGRIVSLPDMERAYRSHAYSSCNRDVEELSTASQFWLALRMKSTLLRTAATLNVPADEKWELIKLTLHNFLHHPLGRLPEFRADLENQRVENGILRDACEERLNLIHQQDAAMRLMTKRIEELENQLAQTRAADENAR
ncbi:glycosyl transferase family 2 [Roseimicrobium gellanilyticum]|uniref:Glycosyl transferase family 2 n=1 Tax=Roseimicrobium gellanilyticum TaxID=748857 RepID=A0A366H5J2_9BACT|nr:glycosyltransferase family 2 protein [Roseimicrobium gellanilyticum]RBP37337.1 glycosyl transferase family 2 [Roseimicrobium gellanilyticum]